MWHNIPLLKKLSNFFFCLFFLAVVAGVCAWLLKKPVYALQLVKVQSMDGKPLNHVSDMTVRNIAVPGIKGNFFTADLEEVRQAFESVPWVHKASVRREWPDILLCAVEPQNAAILSGGSVGTHQQMGIGDGLIPDVLDTGIYNEIQIVTDEEAIHTTKELAQSNVRPTLPDAEAGDITAAMPMMLAMDQVVPGFAAYETLLYAPELKFYSNRVKMDEDLNTSVKRLHCLGDSSGWTRGLMMASAMGVLMGRRLAGC